MKSSDFLINMGQRIASRRKALNLTQEQFAEKLGVSTQMISNLELGKKAIRPENLAKVCKVLELSADYILNANCIYDEISDIANKLSSLNKKELKIIRQMIDYMNESKN